MSGGIGSFAIGVSAIGGGGPPPSRVIVLPYARTSLIRIPRRDLVLSSYDSPLIRVSIIASDDPMAQAIVLTGGLGGPALVMSVWRDSRAWRWDYGAPPVMVGDVLWTIRATISDAPGSFDIAIPPGAMANWPRRCGYAFLLGWGVGDAEVLAQGVLHIQQNYGPTVPSDELVITTDALDPITTD
jgi:hypothetical protein